MKPKKMTRDEIESIVARAVTDAVDFIESDIAPDRLKAQRYYNGEIDIGAEEGRSKVVATKARDAVRAVKPSLMRVFTAHQNPVEFVPKGPDDVQGAQQATDYVKYIFQRQGGFRILNDAMHDALVKKVGIVKAWFDEAEEVEIQTFNNLTDEAFALLVNDDDIDVLEHDEDVDTDVDEMGMQVQKVRHSCKVSRVRTTGKIRMDGLPPEEFFVDRNARSFTDFYVIGHSTLMRVGQLVAMGFDMDEVVDLGGEGDSETDDDAEFERRGYTVDDDEDENALDPSMKNVLVTEAYMKMDVEGTGIPLLYCFLLGGSKYKLLRHDVCEDHPFAIFEVDTEPHSFFGNSLVELLLEDQDAASVMLRGMLDNVQMVNNPATEVVDGQVNVDDLLNNEYGRIIRTKTPGAMREISIPSTAATNLPALQYFDATIENKTGISRASQGLDADVLQSASATAVAATTAAASGQVEVIARNLAETGMTRLFKLLLRLVVKSADAEVMMRLNDAFVPVDPRHWSADMDVDINVGIGTGREAEKAAVLRETFMSQTQIWQAYGPSNGLVTLTQMRNTLADILALGGIKNAARYYQPMDPQTEQALMQAAQQAAQGQQQGSDPNAAFLQSEQMKVQARMQEAAQKNALDGQKAMAEHQRKMQEMAMTDDRARDAMAQDLAIKVAEILGKHGPQVDVARLRAEQQAPRGPMGGMNGQG